MPPKKSNSKTKSTKTKTKAKPKAKSKAKPKSKAKTKAKTKPVSKNEDIPEDNDMSETEEIDNNDDSTNDSNSDSYNLNDDIEDEDPETESDQEQHKLKLQSKSKQKKRHSEAGGYIYVYTLPSWKDSGVQIYRTGRAKDWSERIKQHQREHPIENIKLEKLWEIPVDLHGEEQKILKRLQDKNLQFNSKHTSTSEFFVNLNEYNNIISRLKRTEWKELNCEELKGKN